MDHAPAVRVGDRVAHVDESAQQLAERQGALGRVAIGIEVSLVKALGGLFQALTADEPHGVKRPSFFAGAQAVDRHDAGVFQPAGHLGLDQEPRAAGGVVGVLGLDLLERDLAVQLGIQSDGNHSDAAPSMVPQEPEAAPFRRRLAQTEAPVQRIWLAAVRAVGSTNGEIARGEWIVGAVDREQGKGVLRVWLWARARCHSLASPSPVIMLLNMAPNQPLEHGPIILGERTALDHDPGHRPRPFFRPALKRGDEVGLIDQPVLKRQDAEKQVSLGFDDCHEMILRERIISV